MNTNKRVDRLAQHVGADDGGDPDDLFMLVGHPDYPDRTLVRRADLPKSCGCLRDAVVGTDGVARRRAPGGGVVVAKHKEGCPRAR